MIDEARLIAWLDGEAGPEESAAIERAVAADPSLAALAARHRAVAQRLKAGFAPLLTEPVPVPGNGARSARIVDLAAARAARAAANDAAPRRRDWPRWAGLAATLVVGLAVGRLALTPLGLPLVVDKGGALFAGRDLGRALDTELASTPAAGSGAIRIALTFKARDGRICRSWSAPREAGLACHTPSGWAIAATAAASRAGGDYRMAAGGDPALVAAVEAMIVDSPFDAAQEVRARAAGWR